MTTFIITMGFLFTFFVGLLTGAALATLGRSREEERLRSENRELLNRSWPTQH
jgi:hypothetical protein